MSRVYYTSILFLSVLAAHLFMGCVYERVDILVGTDTYNGTILSNHDDVEVGKASIILKPGARFAIRTPFVTEFLGQYELAILAGEGMTAYLRTVAHEFDTSQGIAFRYSTSGSSIRTPDGRTVMLPYNAELGAQETLTLYNEAALFRVEVGCRRLYEFATDMPGTEYVIFETLPGSTVELRTINYFNSDAK